MRQVLYALLVSIIFTLTACQKDNVGLTNQESAADLSAVTDALNMTANTTSSTCKHSTSTQAAAHHGKQREITEIATTALPTAITTYITSNYAGSTVLRAGTDSSGYYYIMVSKADETKIGLLFNASGNFVQEIVKAHKGCGTAIDAASLPTTIKTYISTNYATATIHKAFVEKEGGYRVILTQADSTFLGLAFDANGNFLNSTTVKDKHGKKKKKNC